MTAKVRALVPWVPGTNCHHEMAAAFEAAGAQAEILPLKKSNRPKLYETDMIGLPGGFSWGDHFGSGRIAAIDLVERFRDELLEALSCGIPIIGVCNGFQKLVNAGLLPHRSVGKPTAALDQNLSGNFEHWLNIKLVMRGNSVWTTGMNGQVINLPVAHGEGRLILPQGDVNIIATYGTPQGMTEYPASPNGSPIAGITDETGLIMGMMPHPERRIDELHGGDDGLQIFRNAVDYVRG